MGHMVRVVSFVHGQNTAESSDEDLPALTLHVFKSVL